jgi:hypothetical protein
MVFGTARAVTVREGRAGEGAGDEQERERAGAQEAGANAGEGHGCTQYAYRACQVKVW